MPYVYTTYHYWNDILINFIDKQLYMIRFIHKKYSLMMFTVLRENKHVPSINRGETGPIMSWPWPCSAGDGAPLCQLVALVIHRPRPPHAHQPVVHGRVDVQNIVFFERQFVFILCCSVKHGAYVERVTRLISNGIVLWNIRRWYSKHK